MAKLRSSEILIVDVESTCWSGPLPLDQRSEIIEIGACLLSTKTMGITKASNVFVRPIASSVSDFCTQLTGITQKDVDGGLPFGEACKWLVSEFDAAHVAWSSYGDYDRNQFQRNCNAIGVKYPFSDRHFNIKSLIALFKGWGEEVGMDTTLKRLDLKLEGTHHRAGDDAKNIASILKYMMAATRFLDIREAGV